MIVEVTVEFTDGTTELFLVWVHPHSSWLVTNVDGMHRVNKLLPEILSKDPRLYKSMCARTQGAIVIDEDIVAGGGENAD